MPAKNNKKMLIAAVFHFVDPLQRQVKTSQDNTKLCQRQLLVNKSQMQLTINKRSEI